MIDVIVYTLDVWGHGHAECKDHQCPCVCAECHGEGAVYIGGQFGVDREDLEKEECPACAGREEPGDSGVECVCEWDVNDRSRFAVLSFSETPDSRELYAALVECGALHGPFESFVFGEDTVDDEDGRPRLQLEINN